MKLYNVSVWEPNCDPGGYQGRFWVLAADAQGATAAARCELRYKYPGANGAFLMAEIGRTYAGDAALLEHLRDQCAALQPNTDLGMHLCIVRARYAAAGGKFMNRQELDRYLEEV